MVDSVENTTSDGVGNDISNGVEVDESEVKLFSIEELVPSSTPITIPYLEIFRTNELEYVPYISPYNVGILSSDENEMEDISDTESSDTESSDSDTESSENNESNN